MENLNLVFYNYLNQFNSISMEEFEKLTPYIFVKELRAKEKLTEEGQLEENIYFVVF
jgi:hypothetical protein